MAQVANCFEQRFAASERSCRIVRKGRTERYPWRLEYELKSIEGLVRAVASHFVANLLPRWRERGLDRRSDFHLHPAAGLDRQALVRFLNQEVGHRVAEVIEPRGRYVGLRLD